MKTPSSSGKDMHVYEFDENATDLTKVSPTQEPYEYERPTLVKDDCRDCRLSFGVHEKIRPHYDVSPPPPPPPLEPIKGFDDIRPDASSLEEKNALALFVVPTMGFRNTNGQIAASFTANGKFVISASEDSYVYIWNYDSPNTPAARNQGVCRAYEYLSSRSVSAAIPWPGMKPEPLVSHQGELLSGHRYNLELMLQGPLNAGRKSGSFPQVAICQVSEGSIHNASYVSMSGNSEAWLSSAERNANISEGIRVRDIIERYVPEIKKPHVFVTCNGKASVFRNIRADASIISDSMSGSLQANLTASSASHRALDHSSPNHGFWAETLSKGSATWPEEKLSPLSNQFPSNLAVAEPPNSVTSPF